MTVETLNELSEKDGFEIPSTEGQAIHVEYTLVAAGSSADEEMKGVVHDVKEKKILFESEGGVKFTVTTERHGVQLYRTGNGNLGGVQSITLIHPSVVDVGD